MLLDEFHNSVLGNSNFHARDMFSIFFGDWRESFSNDTDLLEEIAWQMYQMQVCIEGFLEDADG